MHLLGYFVRLDDGPLQAALARLCAHRTTRFWDMVERLRRAGAHLEEEHVQAQAASPGLGRRHLAQALIQSRSAASVREAFTRYLGDGGSVAVPKLRLPIALALTLVRGAGGVASWAHPSYDCNGESLGRLRALGLRGVEASYSGFPERRRRELRTLAAAFGLAVTGGSDCHGPEPLRRAIGTSSISAAELEHLRQQVPGNRNECRSTRR